MNKKILVSIFAVVILGFVHAAEAQQAKVSRIGFLGSASRSSNPTGIEAFRQGLRDLGYVEGKNIVIDYRWAEGRAERLSDLAAELVSLKPDVLFTPSPQSSLAAKKATTTIPIIFLGIADPGGNITGLSNLNRELSGKRLELLKESVPKVLVVAVLWNGTSPGHPGVLKETEVAAQSLGLTLQPLEVRIPDDFDGAFKAATSRRVQALLPLGDPLMSTQRRRILDFAAKNRLPAMYAQNEYVEAGGLMSYGPDMPASYRRAATYVDKVLKGAKPSDLPVEQPMKFELVINLKTAKQIGLTIPPEVLARATKLIK
jgi:putative tryptophan/tyrosine transport system substrate-binding protein